MRGGADGGTEMVAEAGGWRQRGQRGAGRLEVEVEAAAGVCVITLAPHRLFLQDGCCHGDAATAVPAMTSETEG